MIDYIQLPRTLIYKHRENLNDFGVKIPGTINHELFLSLKDIYRATDRAKELILRCFNNAYYICTLIPFEEFPEMQVAEYEKMLMRGDTYAREEVCVLSMAMVAKLMQAYDARWRQEDNELIKNIHYRFTHYQWMHSGARSSFEKIFDNHNTDGLILPPNEFAPRDIIEPIEKENVGILDIYQEYICERLALTEDPDRRLYGTDRAIARLKNDLNEIYDKYGYDYATYEPKLEDLGTPNDLWADDIDDDLGRRVKSLVDDRNAAIAFYSENYQKIREGISQQTTHIDEQPKAIVHSSEIINLRERIKVLTDENKRLQTELSKAQAKIEEFMQPVEELTAEQKVRMAFTLQLLKAAGLTDEKLDQNKSKVATIIHLLTNIGSNNNGTYSPTQMCQNWLVDKLYYPKRNTDTLLELNTLCSKLGIEKAFLPLSQ